MEFRLDISHIENHALVLHKLFIADRVLEDPKVAEELMLKGLYADWSMYGNTELKKEFEEYKKDFNKAFNEYMILLQLKAKEIKIDPDQPIPLDVKLEQFSDDENVSVQMSEIMDICESNDIGVSFQDSQWCLFHNQTGLNSIGKTFKEAIEKLEELIVEESQK